MCSKIYWNKDRGKRTIFLYWRSWNPDFWSLLAWTSYQKTNVKYITYHALVQSMNLCSLIVKRKPPPLHSIMNWVLSVSARHAMRTPIELRPAGDLDGEKNLFSSGGSLDLAFWSQGWTSGVTMDTSTKGSHLEGQLVLFTSIVKQLSFIVLNSWHVIPVVNQAHVRVAYCF